MWPFGGCPDKTCRRLARRLLIVGFICVGKLGRPTDHVVTGVNDLCLCFKQRGTTYQWNMNKADIAMLKKLLDRAVKNDKRGTGDAVKKKNE